MNQWSGPRPGPLCESVHYKRVNGLQMCLLLSCVCLEALCRVSSVELGEGWLWSGCGPCGADPGSDWCISSPGSKRCRFTALQHSEHMSLFAHSAHTLMPHWHSPAIILLLIHFLWITCLPCALTNVMILCFTKLVVTVCMLCAESRVRLTRPSWLTEYTMKQCFSCT